MKKFLLTTTALVATAGFAAAEVSISASAEAGLTKADGSGMRFHNDIDVNFSMSAETDGGLSISTGVDLDEGGANLGGSGHHGTSLALSGDFGNVTLGDTDGAADWATSEIGSIMPGSITDQSTSITGMENNVLDGKYSGQILRYDNSIGGVGFAVSIERPDDTEKDKASMGFAIGAKFDAGPVMVGLGIQNAETAVTASGKTTKMKYDRTVLSANGEASGVSYAVLYSTGKNGSAKTTQMQAGAGYTMDDMTVAVGLLQSKVGSKKENGHALAASYNLGGGAKVLFGYNSDKAYSLGLSMSF